MVSFAAVAILPSGCCINLLAPVIATCPAGCNYQVSFSKGSNGKQQPKVSICAIGCIENDCIISAVPMNDASCILHRLFDPDFY
jgi:hypothetical protein